MLSYKERIELMMEADPVPSMEDRFKAIEEIAEEYYQEYKKQLPSELIQMLGDWCLKEVYSDKSTNKVKLEEYPTLSKHQLKRRTRKTVLIEDESQLSMVSYHIKNSSTIRKD